MSLNVVKGKVNRAQRVILYGQEGVGKTTYVAKLPKVLFLDTEEGTHRLDVDRVPVLTLADMRGAVGELLNGAGAGERPYTTVAIDTADRLWDLCAADVCAANGWESIETPGYGKGMKLATDKFLALLKGFDKLISRGINVILVCHSKVERMAPPDMPEYTMYQPKVSAPGKQAEETKEKLKQWCDILLFAHFVTVLDAKAGRAVGGEPLRRIETQHTAHWEAKCRFDLPRQLTMDGVAELAGVLAGGSTPARAEAPAAQNAAVNAPANAAPHAAANFAQNAPAPDATSTEPAAAAPANFAGNVPQAATNAAVNAPDNAAVPAQPAAPAPAAQQQPVGQDTFLFPEEKKMLTDWFVATGKLQQGQGLGDLPAGIATALMQRPKAALEKAALWMQAELQRGKGVAA